jgi:transmembrane sensor
MKKGMDKHKHTLEDLIRKYENGDTSLVEEQELLQYLTEQDIEPQYAGIQAQFLYYQAQKEVTPRISIVPGTQADRRPIERMLPAQYLRMAAMVAMAVGIGWWAFWYNVITTVTTGPHERTQVVLPDGTTVYLNSSSELSYNLNVDDDQRTVRLKGEAYFDVQRDATRPFIIQSGNTTTEVLGTSFNLRSYADEEFDALDVREGRVRFGAGEKIVVEQGGGARYYRQQHRLEGTQAQVNADAWKSRKLTFVNVTLKDAIRELERFYHVTIHVKTQALLQCHFTAEFTNTPIDEVMEVISSALEFRYSKEGDIYLLSGQPCTP